MKCGCPFRRQLQEPENLKPALISSVVPGSRNIEAGTLRTSCNGFLKTLFHQTCAIVTVMTAHCSGISSSRYERERYRLYNIFLTFLVPEMSSFLSQQKIFVSSALLTSSTTPVTPYKLPLDLKATLTSSYPNPSPCLLSQKSRWARTRFMSTKRDGP